VALPGLERKLCLLDDEDKDALCRRGEDGVSLTGLLLSAGRHTFELQGAEDAADLYRLRVDTTSAAAADFESEPNDDTGRADPIDPALGMRARGHREDKDVFRLRTDGEPQLWQVDVAGSEIRRLEWIRAAGNVITQGDIDEERSAATMSDLYLVPGDHWFRVRTDGGEYTLQTTPLGPPHPDGEREPNDEAQTAQRYRIGTRIVGRLPTASDRDLYRFTLAATQHIRLDLAQPADARTALRLWSRDEAMAELQGLPAGHAIAYDLWLEPGGYTVELYPEQSSDGTYELTSERLDPFALRVDQEPNDDPGSARAISRSLAWTGQAGHPRDEDWYIIPPLTSDELLISVTGEETSVRLGVLDEGSGRLEQLVLDRGTDGMFASTDHPPDVPLVLRITGEGDYGVELSGGGLVGALEPSTPGIEMDWQVSHEEVAAYWPEEQVIESSLALTNSGSEDLELVLETTTSHYRWQASLAQGAILVPAGETISVLAEIVVGTDAWGAEPVLVSARAITPGGAEARASVSISTSAEARPVNPRRGWSVPDELLGGLNAASLAFGAEPGGTLDADRERRLFDGVTPQGSTAIASPIYGNGFSVFIRDHVERLPIEMMVDLAGDVTVPVVGTIINHQAGDGDLGKIPIDFELLLSRDGLAFEPAIAGTLSSLSIDQAFVLDEPVEATHAMLRILSKHGAQRGFVALGEWKVIVAPGTALSSEPVNIAHPVHGGHVVSIEPMGREPDVGTLLLDDELEPAAIDIEAGETLNVVIGFRDGRAALVDRLEWQDPERSDTERRLERVDVAMSLRSPTGPWRSLGEWEPQRAADGRVEPFPLDGATWVRSAVFAFDTSSSIEPFLDMVTQGMRSFLADVRPGREVVTVLPFDEAALVEGWQDDPYILQAAFDNHVVEGQGSSAAESGLIDASSRLREREGARAILLVTDAETTSADRTPQLWDDLARVRPIIFSVHIGAVVEPLRSRQRMQDWAASGSGHYSYPTTHGEMDRAFDRMATWLRRSADYTLSYETLNLGPSTLLVRAPVDGTATGLVPGVGVEIILDTSGSMLAKLAGERRIDIAKASLRELLGEALADDVPIALRTFGGKGKKAKARCQTRLTLPLQPLERQSMFEAIGPALTRRRRPRRPSRLRWQRSQPTWPP
jgi:hypothetical protein